MDMEIVDAGNMLIISAPHLTAAVIFDGAENVITAAPILAYMKGWHITKVEEYAKEKGWTTSCSILFKNDDAPVQFAPGAVADFMARKQAELLQKE
jgi:hypothetical protein